MDGNMNRALQELPPAEAEHMAAETARLAAERRSARIDAALQAGWALRFDPVRLEHSAARELVTARTMDELLDAIEGPQEDSPA